MDVSSATRRGCSAAGGAAPGPAPRGGGGAPGDPASTTGIALPRWHVAQPTARHLIGGLRRHGLLDRRIDRPHHPHHRPGHVLGRLRIAREVVHRVAGADEHVAMTAGHAERGVERLHDLERPAPAACPSGAPEGSVGGGCGAPPPRLRWRTLWCLCGDGQRPCQHERAHCDSKRKTRHSLLLVERQLETAHCSARRLSLLDAHRGVHYDERLFRLQTTLQ